MKRFVSICLSFLLLMAATPWGMGVDVTEVDPILVPVETGEEGIALSSDDWECTVLDEESYKQFLIEDMGMGIDEAERKAQEHFAKWGKFNARASDYQTVLFSRYRHPGSFTRYEVRFGFVAVMTTGSTPLFVSIDSKYSNPVNSGGYTFDKGAQSAIITNSTTVKMNYDGYVTVAVQNGYATGSSISVSSLVGAGFQYSTSTSGTDYYRYYLSCYDTVRPSWVS
ncbi:MAG: hypothetical protein Q4D42_06640 [Eubacteriales bacterium]|nr:hypothetical protein [Eubacteriales bacterium]